MPRLPVTVRRTAAVALMIAVGVALGAQAAVAVRSIDDLRNNNKELMNLDDMYKGFSAANVVYDRCAADLSLTPQQQEYQRQLFTQTAAKYLQSYSDAYLKLVGAPAPQNVIDYCLKYVTDEQQQAVNAMASFIDKRGCQNSTVKKIYISIETYRSKDEASKNKPTDPWSK